MVNQVDKKEVSSNNRNENIIDKEKIKMKPYTDEKDWLDRLLNGEDTTDEDGDEE